MTQHQKAGTSIDSSRPRARRLDLDRKAQEEEDEEEEDEVEATKEEDRRVDDADVGDEKKFGGGEDRQFYYPGLLRAACHFCDHLPDDAPLQDIVKRFPFTAAGRLNVPPHAAATYVRDLDKNRAPKGLKRRRQGHTSVVSMGAAYLARQTLALLRDSIDTEMARNIWQRAATGQCPCYGEYTGGSCEVMELREVARAPPFLHKLEQIFTTRGKAVKF